MSEAKTINTQRDYADWAILGYLSQCDNPVPKSAIRKAFAGAKAWDISGQGDPTRDLIFLKNRLDSMIERGLVAKYPPPDAPGNFGDTYGIPQQWHRLAWREPAYAFIKSSRLSPDRWMLVPIVVAEGILAIEANAVDGGFVGSWYTISSCTKAEAEVALEHGMIYPLEDRRPYTMRRWVPTSENNVMSFQPPSGAAN